MAEGLSSKHSDSTFLLKHMPYADPVHKTRLSWSQMVLWGSSLGTLDLRTTCLSLPLGLFCPPYAKKHGLGHGMAFFILPGSTYILLTGLSSFSMPASPPKGNPDNPRGGCKDECFRTVKSSPPIQRLIFQKGPCSSCKEFRLRL